MSIKRLQDLIDSEDFQNNQFGSSSDDWIADPERMERCEAAAKYGGDGSTHGERLDDMREYLGNLSLDEETHDAISKEIDEIEEWHLENGTLDEEVG